MKSTARFTLVSIILVFTITAFGLAVRLVLELLGLPV